MTDSNRRAPVLSDRQRTIVVSLFLVAVIFAVFWPLLSAEFLNYDDPDFVTANPHVLRGLNWESVSWAFSSLYIYWQPLTWLSYMLDYEWYGLSSRGFHFTNLLLHAISAVLLFLALKAMTRAHWRSAFVAALFALHPLHIETVAWISERKGVLCALFWMLALCAYARHAGRPAWGRYLLVAVCYAAGLMAKSMVITLPAVLLLLDFWPLRRFRTGTQDDTAAGPIPSDAAPPFPQSSLRQLFMEKAALLPFALGSALVTLTAQVHGGNVWSAEQLSFWQRATHAFVAYVGYLRKTIWPNDLAVFYPHPLHHPLWVTIGALFFLIVVTGVFTWQFLRRPYLLVGWLWFLGTLAPVIGLLQTGDQAMADRYTYIPLVGVFIIMSWGGFELLTRLRLRSVPLGACPVAVVAACVLITGAQARCWRNTQTLFEKAVVVTEGNYVAYAALGAILAEAGRPAEAQIYFARSLECNPRYFAGHAALADALSAQGRHDEAITHYETAIKLSPNFADAYNGLGAALVRQGKSQEGLALIERALQINPAHMQAQLNWAVTAQRMGRVVEAAARYSEILRYHPNSTNALIGLGNSLLVQGKFSAALVPYRQLLLLNPDFVEVLHRVAWILSTHEETRTRNGVEALRLARRACELTGNTNPASLNVLAAAYAEVGQFDQAVVQAGQAEQLARASGQTGLADIIQKLLEMYRQGRSYRERAP